MSSNTARHPAKTGADPMRQIPAFVLGVGCILASTAAGQDLPAFPEGAPIPRSLTAAERAYLAENPLVPGRAATAPTGPVHCVAEYEPMEAILIAWEGGSSWTDILAEMARHITTTGDANVIVVVDSTSERNSATATISAEGADMNRVQTIVRTTDTIWIRDYGPRYIYEGGCRAIVDHTYNRPRPNDNALNAYFATVKRHAVYPLPLIHGGGNYHLSANGESFTTRLINNENPSLSEQQIHDLWAQYQNLDTTFRTPFPTNVDSTQHIDMWMQVFSDDGVMISDWPLSSGSTQDNICDNTASVLAGRGYDVHRIPAVHSGGTHYTFTNVVMCNDLVLIPSYANSTASSYNAAALAAWQAALPGKTVVQIPAQSIVTAAGVLHCIVMHIPEPTGGAAPTVYRRNLRGGETLTPGEDVLLEWISDDDVAVTSIDIALSTDGGATWPYEIAPATADDGAFSWTVPDVYATRARLRLLARDADLNTGEDVGDADFTILGTPPACPEDLDGDGTVDLEDLARLLAAFGQCSGDPGYDAPADFDASGCIDLADLSRQLGVFGGACE